MECSECLDWVPEGTGRCMVCGWVVDQGASPDKASGVGIPAYAGVSGRAAAPPVPVEQTPFVGREEELRRLRDFLSTQPESARMAMIEGDPGVGKTRLVEEALTGLARLPAFVTWAAQP